MGTRSIVVSIVAGLIFGAAWFILVDGIVWSNTYRDGVIKVNPKTKDAEVVVEPHPEQPPFLWYYIFPAILITAIMVLLNLVSPAQLSGGDFDGSSSTKVKVWVFIMIACAIVCIGGAIWVSAADFGAALLPPTSHGGTPLPTTSPWLDSYTVWPGVALVINTILQMVSGALFWAGRKGSEYESF